MESHRYVRRIRHLLTQLDGVLRERGGSLRLTVLGVDHTGHFFPEWVPELAGADLVTLELPTTPVRAFLEGRTEEVRVRNVFWTDLLTHFAAHPPPAGVVGVNVNPHVRYLRGRFYYRNGFLVNDFEAPHVVVDVGSDQGFSLPELGAETEGVLVPASEVPAWLPEALQQALARNGMVHVGPGENPFGPGRHLVVLRPPPEEWVRLVERLDARLALLAEECGLPEGPRGQLGLSLLEGFLIPVNDFYLMEQLLIRATRAAREMAPGKALQVTHVAGFAHTAFLLRYARLTPSERIGVEAVRDPRFPLHPAVMVPAWFAERMEAGLEAASLQGEAWRLDAGAALALVDAYAASGDDLRRQVLLKAIWHREPAADDPPPLSWAAETPLRPSAAYVDAVATRLDLLVLEYALAELPLRELEAINARLQATGRRGRVPAVAQELHERGLGYRELRAHPFLGRYIRRAERLREGLLAGEEPAALFRNMMTADDPET